MNINLSTIVLSLYFPDEQYRMLQQAKIAGSRKKGLGTTNMCCVQYAGKRQWTMNWYISPDDGKQNDPLCSLYYLLKSGQCWFKPTYQDLIKECNVIDFKPMKEVTYI